ncbi:UDP-N-acetylglucosamine transferase subunit ALG13 like protein [Cyphomyrmex costatus]|uniref:UDP-N-acetylglucosamine transferase subunit ALG13 like protein n=2 Tax=Cyphomyrmex costatus TaxID=456900 RepID=A0A195C6Q1_9HYME|nr:UDP-N-acetylglucosamine transferase subunit ALG13 like protein [Cyphomyrmex costatus]
MSKRTQEPVDQWLAKEGYFRKPTPRDPTCLFRAVSEQVYHTQHYHLRVRKECIEFMKKKRHLFIDSVSTPFDYYLNEMQCFTEWGGSSEIHAMSLLYKRDIIIFVGEKQICENVTNNGFKKGVILLCHTEPKQYEPVYPMAFVQSAAYCQSIVYEVVYRYMYQIPNIRTVADRMLHNRTPVLRHDKFFQKGNLDIREQLIEDLYKKVKNEHSDVDEAQSDWKGAPIPYKVAKALAPDYYRNIELDIWHELKREVKSAGWNRYNSNELQVGGKCLIEISINDLQQCDRNNNKNVRVNLPECSTSETNNKIEQQKLKQGPLWLHGYIQEMNTEKEPVLVFIKDLGEKKFVPYDALKPLPLIRKNRQKNWVPVNRNHSVTVDSNRRWKKPYNSFSRKRKDTIVITNEKSNNINKNISINNVDDNDIDVNINVTKNGFDERHDELPTNQNFALQNHSTEDSSIHATNEEANNLPVTTTFDNSQSTVSNSVTQEMTEEYKKSHTVFKRVNNTVRKIDKSNNLQKSSKPKVLNENYYSSYNDNSQQTNIYDNPNISYVPLNNGNAYPCYPYVPGNFSITGEHNPSQIDHSLTSNVFYNLHLLHLEDTFRTVNPTYYGPIMYGSNHQGMQSLGASSNAVNSGPYMQYMQEEVDRLVNDMQNCSLNDRPNISAEIPNTSHVNTNCVQSINQAKQGPRNSSGKDSHYIQQKGKQTGTVKGNKIRNRQQNARGSAHMQYSGHQYGVTIPSGSVNPYNAQRHDMHISHMQSQQHHWDPMSHQIAPMVAGPTNGYAPQYTASNQIIPYHELPSHYTGESNSGNPSYYLGNGNYLPVSYLPPQHVDASENGAVPPSYPQHFYSTTEAYPPGHSSINGQPIIYSQPMMYPQSVQYHAVPSPSQHMQEQWNPTLGPQSSYVAPCIAPNPSPAPIVESSPNGQCTVPKGSL